MNWIASEDYLALFFEVSDEDLKRIQNDRDYFRDEEFVRRIQNGTGNNAHIYSLCIKRITKPIKWGVDLLIDKYDSVSWWTVKHRKFFIRSKK